MQPLHSEDPSQLADYRLLGRLGAGGMGRVYLARSTGGRAVALKVVRPELADSADFRARFRREVAAARRVSGAHVVPVTDANPDGPTPWLATAYVPGPSLADAVAGHGPLPEPAVRVLAAGLAAALAEVHGSGLVHRDLKPSNVLLALDGPRLIDFGIARAADETALTGTGLTIGSPGYMSPEQADGRDITAASDVFSLGAVLVFAATGQGPFGTGSTPALLYRVVHTAPDLTAVPSSLLPLVTACLRKNPHERPAPAELMAFAEGPSGATAHGGWLPPPITYAIAERSSALLDLDTTPPDDTGLTPPPTPVAEHPSPQPDTAAVSPPLPGEAVPGAVSPREPVQDHRSAPPPQLPTSTAATPETGPAASAPPIPPPPDSVPPTPPAEDVQGTETLWRGPVPPPPPVPPTPAPPSPAPDVRERPGLTRRRLLIGGTAAGLAAAGGVTAWLTTRSGGGKNPAKASGSGGPVPAGAAGGTPTGPKPLFKLAFQGPLTGSNADMGTAARNGAKLAVAQAGRDTGLPFQLELVEGDDAGDSTKADAIVRQFTSDSAIVALVGPLFSATVKTAANALSAGRLPMVTPGATNTALAADNRPWFQRGLPSNTAQGEDLGAYLLAKVKPASVVVCTEGFEYADSVLTGLNKVLSRGGVRIVDEIGVVHGKADYSAEVAKVLASGAPAMVYLGLADQGGPFAKQLKAAGYTGRCFSPNGLADPQFVTLAGGAAEGWQIIDSSVDAAAEPALAGFAADYKAAFGSPPPPYAAEAYDAVGLIVDTMKRLGNARNPVSRENLFTGLRAAKYHGAVRDYAFDPATGEYQGKGTFLYEVRNGAIAYLGSTAKVISG
ncbi:ABC transporter substrate-binding protein [Yinghuangia seranimata]|uniref:ABC transporter substrate-binding protein n=1 Tax=Yinghuangia seranimata TaxID=408067 RepID=UPI00248C6612|nr:ABC transporter substrate-binding protein [Yinghuangia seranimata]MDI2126690.1 ABC transporter substrate-binding protein [Yinghuangia seranimata]